MPSPKIMHLIIASRNTSESEDSGVFFINGALHAA